MSEHIFYFMDLELVYQVQYLHLIFSI